MPSPLLLQAAQLAKPAIEAVGNVNKFANQDAFTTLLWLVNLVFGGVIGLLFYKYIWKANPEARISVLETELAATKAELTERKRTADADRLQDKLKFEGDLGAIAGTITKLVEAADRLTTITERVAGHTKLHERHEESFRQLHTDIRELRQNLTSWQLDNART